MRISTCFILMTSFTSLVSAHQPEITLESETLVKSTQSWDGSQLASYPKGQPEITILKITIPAGFKLPLHQHPYINAGVLTKGELTVVTKTGKKLLLSAGDPIIEIVDKWHFGENSGKVAAEIIVFYAGIKGQPITIK
jgi:quercetin dioxygenase-like cupin family protein